MFFTAFARDESKADWEALKAFTNSILAWQLTLYALRTWQILIRTEVATLATRLR